VVAGPVRAPREEHVELERHDAREERRRDGGRVHDGGQVRELGRGLVEEAQARERRRAEVPELLV
jgi:hypothetical protein